MCIRERDGYPNHFCSYDEFQMSNGFSIQISSLVDFHDTMAKFQRQQKCLFAWHFSREETIDNMCESSVIFNDNPKVFHFHKQMSLLIPLYDKYVFHSQTCIFKSYSALYIVDVFSKLTQ